MFYLWLNLRPLDAKIQVNLDTVPPLGDGIHLRSQVARHRKITIQREKNSFRD